MTRPRGEDGFLSLFVAICIVGLVALVLSTMDSATRASALSEAIGVANSAARAGAQPVDLVSYRGSGAIRIDPKAAIVQAEAYLAQTAREGRARIVTDVTTGEPLVEVTVSVTRRLSLRGRVHTAHGRGRARLIVGGQG